jgi:hypothetical protein
MWQAGVEVASCCSAMCQLRFDLLLMWVAVVVPCGMGHMMRPNDRLPCGTLVGSICQMSCIMVWPTC